MPSFKNRSIDFLWKSNDKVLLGGKFNFKQAKKKKGWVPPKRGVETFLPNLTQR